jgi:fibronectin type 3 domain-containing protein
MAWQLWEWAAEVFAERQRARRRAQRAFRPRLELLETRELLTAAPLLHIGADGRHLFDASNHPFYLIGDTGWALPAGLTLAQATSYFQTRASQGFNTVLMDADVELGASPVGAPVRGPNDANGNPPFNAFLPGTNLFDVSTPNAAYWQNIDNIIKAAAQNGIEIILNTYDNYNPWFGSGSSPNSTAKLTAYGQFLGQRYANFDNIIWMIGNDYTENSGGDASLAAVIQGIRQFDTRHVGFAFDTYGATFDNTGLRQYLQLNTIYEYSPGPWRSLYLSQYNRSDFGPIFNVESGYENNTSLGVSLADVRDEHYSFLLNGATGDIYGNEDVWPFASSWRDWQAALNSPGGHQMTYFANLLKSIPWSHLIPDQSGTVFAGVGSPTDYSGAYTADGTLALAYQPATGSGSQSFTVNMGRFVGSVTAEWYDPTNGAYTAIGTFANSGSRTFTAPSINSAGENDFVLVLRAAATVPAAPTGLTARAADTQVALRWTASGGAISYNIYRSTTSGGEVKIATTPATITTTSYIDTGLTNGTTYYYKVTAVNSAGESALSTEASATPLFTPPTAPTNLRAAGGNTRVSLRWSAVAGAASYNIYRSTKSGGEIKITTTPATITTTSYTDTGLTNGTTYYYEVTAVNGAGDSGKSAEVSAKPSAFVLDAAYGFGEGSGTTTTDASGNGNTGTIVGATWTTAGKHGTALSFDGTSNYVDLGNATSLNTTGSLTVSAWIKASSFPFDDAAIVSKRDNTEHGFQLDTTVDRGPRTIGFKLSDANGNLFARYGATTLAANTWYYVTGVYDAVHRTLHVYLNGQLDDGDLVGTVAGSQTPSTRDAQIGQRPGYPGTFNFAGTIDDVRIYGSAVTAGQIQTDMNTPVGAPAAPTNLVATVGNTQVRLTWTAAAGATSYNIYRSTTPGGEGASPYRTGATGTSFTDSGLTNGTRYYYRLTAVNGAGESVRSPEVSALPAAPGRSINAGGGATGSFAADTLFSGGGNKITTQAITTTGVANSAPEAVYQSARIGSSFSYTVSNLTPGTGGQRRRPHRNFTILRQAIDSANSAEKALIQS